MGGEDISLWSTFVQQSLSEVGIPVEIVRNDRRRLSSSRSYDDHAFDLRHRLASITRKRFPAVSTTVWYRSGQPKGAPWTNQWGWQDATVDKTIR